jgi:hypothetical protein
MNRNLSLLAAAVVGLGVVGVARDARALGPVDLEVGAKVGYATSPTSENGAPNPLGFGLGGRAGLSFLGGFYAGGSLMYYLGGSSTLQSEAGAQSVSTNTLMYGGEVGYGFNILLLTIRPQVGIGNATFTASSGGVSQSTSNWYLEPGVTGLIGLGLLYVGADVNALVFPGLQDSQTGVSFHGQIGVKF